MFSEGADVVDERREHLLATFCGGFGKSLVNDLLCRDLKRHNHCARKVATIDANETASISASASPARALFNVGGVPGTSVFAAARLALSSAPPTAWLTITPREHATLALLLSLARQPGR